MKVKSNDDPLLEKIVNEPVGKHRCHMVEWLRERNCKSMLIWVLKDNPTRKFYEAMGGKVLAKPSLQLFFAVNEIALAIQKSFVRVV